MLARTVNAAVAAWVTRRVFDTVRNGAAAERWERMNHRGEPVTLAQGLAVSAGSVAALLVARGAPAHLRVASALAVGGAAGLGMIDDLTGATDVKGLGGHLGALRRGEVTTGTVKLVGLAGTGYLAGALARRGRGGVIDAGLAGAVIAGSANLVNLFDLRPGRATKVFLSASAGPLTAGGPQGVLIAAPVGAASALLPDDLAERSMLGDTGANALGAAWGVWAASALRRPALLLTLAGLAGVTVLSERVSFSEIIERTPVLRGLDAAGRRPSLLLP